MKLIPNIGTPFILNRIEIKRDVFLNTIKECTLIPFSEYGVISSSTDTELSKSIKAAIGEHVERISLFANNNRFTSPFLDGIDLVNGNKIKIPIHQILLSFHSSLFKDYKQKDFFNDSCGLASHVNSKLAINSAFLECFERQSLIFNWLTQSKAKKIPTSFFQENLNIKKFLNLSKFHIEDIHFFDISLHSDIKVVLCLAFGEQTKGVAVSANWNYSDAILGSLKELFQYITVPQNNILDEEELSDHDPYYYGNYFFKKLNTNDLKEKFKYLLINNDFINELDFNDNSHSQINNIKTIQKISLDLNLDFVVCHIPTVLPNINTKVVKVITTLGFPHMNTKNINPEEIPFLKNFPKIDFPNAYKTIPFG